MKPIRHYPMPDADDNEDGLDAEQALLFGGRSSHEPPPPPPRWQKLISGLVLALTLVAGAYIIVSLAEMGWGLLPW